MVESFIEEKSSFGGDSKRSTERLVCMHMDVVTGGRAIVGGRERRRGGW